MTDVPKEDLSSFMKRNRFLHELDLMLMKDKEGAIDDMLQVLRERGVIKECQVSIDVSTHGWEDPEYQRYLKETMGDYLGNFLYREGQIKTEFSDGSNDYTKRMTGSLTVVRQK